MGRYKLRGVPVWCVVCEGVCEGACQFSLVDVCVHACMHARALCVCTRVRGGGREIELRECANELRGRV